MGREKAHDKISAICIAVSQGKGRLIDLLTEDPEIGEVFDRQALGRLLEPRLHLQIDSPAPLQRLTS